MTIDCQKTASPVEFNMIVNGREEILNLTVIRSRVADTIGGYHRQMKSARNANGSLVAPLFLALLMPLKFDIDVLAAKDSRQLLDGFAASRFAAAREGRCQWSLVTPGKADQAWSVLLEVIEVRCSIALRDFSHLEFCDELT
jgi:hypothetical protein